MLLVIMSENLELTIIIPTYNRPKELINTLESLREQNNQKFNVVILDNASTYDVAENIKEYLAFFGDRIHLEKRRFNTGADYNIMSTFVFCKTKYLWMLSDDDQVDENAIDKILKHCNSVGEFGCINFTVEQDMLEKNETVRIIKNVKEFNALYNPAYNQQSKWHGDLIFMSNKVYNMDVVGAYAGMAIKYTYCSIAIVVLIAKMLENNIAYCVINDPIVKHKEPTELGWSFKQVVLGSRILMDVDFKTEGKERICLLRNMAFNVYTIYYCYFKYDKEPDGTHLFFSQLYHSLYKYILPSRQKFVMGIIVFLTRNKLGTKIAKKLLRY